MKVHINDKVYALAWDRRGVDYCTVVTDYYGHIPDEDLDKIHFGTANDDVRDFTRVEGVV